MASFIHRLSGTRITLVAGVFLAASLVFMLRGIHITLDPAWVTIFICGLPLVYSALTRLVFEKRITSALLISIAMGACVYIGEVFAAGEVAFIMAIGEILEDKTVEKAKRGIRELIALAPQQARRIVPHDASFTEETVPVESVIQGDTVRVLPGETVPVDGVILTGITTIDQSVMTGESLPVDKTPGDTVFSGTINRFGAIDIQTTKTGEDSSLQKLIRMVRDAENNKAPMQRIVDQWAGWLVPAAVAIAIVTYFATGNVERAVTVLVVFCPCALALATPTSIMAAIGQATKQGVLIKSGEALEIMGKVDRVAFDKTGTLTFGSLTVTDVLPFPAGTPAEDVLRIAASAESLSEHPLAKAIMARAKTDGTNLLSASDFSMLPGKGIMVSLEGKTALAGTADHLREHGVTVGENATAAMTVAREEGKAAVLIAYDGLCIGMVALADTLRGNAREMVAALEAMNTQVTLLTGDHAQTARWFAERAGITDVRADLLPEKKVACITALQQEGHAVCMIGDGVNDAPALKTADVGVAMGSMGSDIAIEAADIALMGDDISKIPYLKRLSNATVWSIKLNITLSMVVNFVAIILSVTGVLTPVTGALVHNAGSVLIVLNAARLYDKKLV
ncbi:MAG: putative copper-exporting P-type ATPase V [Desulfovibrio sp.]